MEELPIPPLDVFECGVPFVFAQRAAEESAKLSEIAVEDDCKEVANGQRVSGRDLKMQRVIVTEEWFVPNVASLFVN